MGDGKMFVCTLGRRQRVLTLFANILVPVTVLGAIACFAVAAAMAEEPVSKVVFALGLATVLTSGLGLFVFARTAPKGFLVDSAGISLIRRNDKRELLIPAAEIQSVEPLAPESLHGAIRTFGVGGYHGSWGRFRSPALKSFRAYMTNDSYVLVQSAQGPFVLTPDAREEFIAAANQTFNLPRAENQN